VNSSINDAMQAVGHVQCHLAAADGKGTGEFQREKRIPIAT
jgi:hypothetical protein